MYLSGNFLIVLNLKYFVHSHNHDHVNISIFKFIKHT